MTQVCRLATRALQTCVEAAENSEYYAFMQPPSVEEGEEQNKNSQSAAPAGVP